MQSVFDHGLHFLTGDVQTEQHIAERQHLDHLIGRHHTGQRNAHAAAALQRDVGAAILLVGHVQISLGDQLLDVAAAHAHAAFGIAGHAGTAVVRRAFTTRHAARAQLLRHECRLRLLELGHTVLVGLQHLGGGVRRHDHAQKAAGRHAGINGLALILGHVLAADAVVVADQHMRRARTIGDIALGVERHLELAHHLRVFPSLDDADRLAVLVVHARGIGAAWRAHTVGLECIGT
ncbi:hypothetical protein SDC9_126193 [bioreactor metagenome]|uniref:Uncharacterized protein n=1 Tax=bioreactor metagenome TaxID=1076179 RepID=A0A645CPY8_9ZZZZ